MKRNLIGILSLAVMIVLVSATGVYAQSIAKADVPFAFAVGSAQLPAGTYEIKPANSGSSAIMVLNVQSNAGAMANAGREQARNTEPKLVFHRVGSQYFLAEIWRGAGSEGMIVPTSKQEKELEKELQLAKGQAGGYEEVVVALN
jgi:hypothetical protein